MLILKTFSTGDIQNCRSIVAQLVNHGHLDARQILTVLDSVVGQRIDRLRQFVPLDSAGECPSCKSSKTVIYSIEDDGGEILRIFECRANGCGHSHIVED